jgi:alpha-mannosidase
MINGDATQIAGDPASTLSPEPSVLYMIGNAHLDPVWLWRWQEGLQAAKATFRAALDLLAEDPDFVFTSSSAAIYEWVEQNDPAMFDEVRARVAEGRWRIVGGWWIQPDCNLPCGESFARQALYGQRYFREKLGVTASVGYNVDSFGHHAMLPQILRLSGMDSYVMMRPEPAEKGLPGRLFHWESDDGSTVLAYRIPFEYASWGADLERYVRRVAAELRPPQGELMCFYGVGNHGGGPTRANLASIRRMQGDAALPALRYGDPASFFARARASGRPLPTVHDDLQHHASGCYAAHSGIKRWNRQAESLLLSAETWSAVAWRELGRPYPDLAQAWKNVLFNQFHDILAGTSIAAAYEDARDLHGEAMAIAARALNHATQALAWRIAIPFEQDAQPIVVFNPHAWPVVCDVEAELSGLPARFVVRDDEGAPTPAQRLRPSAIVSGWRARIAFRAELPALGWRVYRVGPATGSLAAALPEPLAPVGASGAAIENECLRLEIDPATGCIASLYDKHCGVNVLLGQGARPAVIDDPSDAWGHGVYQFQDVIGQFQPTRLRLVENGPLRAVLRVEYAYGDSTLAQEFALSAGRDQVDVRVCVDWRECHNALKLIFPANLNFLRAVYEIPFGHIERPANGEEEPGQRWLDVSGVVRGAELPYGLSLLNDGKYSFAVRGRELSLTVLRSPIYAHHHPTEPDLEGSYAYLDQGQQEFRYALLPHVGSWQEAATVRRAAELNAPPIGLLETYHDGPLPQRACALEVSPHHVVVSALKRAEDGDATILRCHEAAGIAADATILLHTWGRVVQASFRPSEIKTLRIPDDPALPVAEVNLLEE